MSQTKAQLLDPQGDFTLTGQLIGVGATFSGDVSIGGTLTKQDVTNVDSVGVVTARSGVNISGGNLQVGGTNVINSGLALYNLDSIKLADSKELKLGSSDDLKLYHNGAHSYIHENGNGALKVKGDDIRFENVAGEEALRITSQGSVGIGSYSPVGTLDVTTTAGTGSTVFIYAANHNTSVASEAELRFGFAHSGSPEGIGYIKLKENGTNAFDGNLTFGVPTNNGSGGSVTNDVLFIKGSNQRVGVGSDNPQATLDVNGSFINSNSVNSTGDAGIQISNGHRLGFDQSGTRSWTVKATGGNLEIQSGDGNGSLKGASNGGVSDNKGNLRSVPLNTQGSAYTLVANDAGKAILASGNVTFNHSVMSAGDMVTIINNTNGDISVVAGAGTALYNTADASTGTRTLASRGMASIYFTHNTTGYISGSGLS